MIDTQESNLPGEVAGTQSTECHGFKNRRNRASHQMEHLSGSATSQPASTQAQLDTLDAALNAVNVAWFEVVRNPHAFSAIVGHYCDEAADYAECVERLRAALDLEPVRFAIRLARRQPWKPNGDPSDFAHGISDQPQDPRVLAQRLYEWTRTLPGPLKTDEERHEMVRELLGIIDIDLDPTDLGKTTSPN